MAEQFKVIGQRQVNQVSVATSRIEPFMEVTFTDLSTNTTDKVTVPIATYSAEAVRAAITERLATIRQVANLTE